MNNMYECSVQLVLQWMFSMYTHKLLLVLENVYQKMDKLCKALNKSSSKKNIPGKHWNDYESFVELEMNLFGIDTTE